MSRLRAAGYVAALVIAFGGLLATAGPAFGHALPQSSDPGRGVDLPTSPTAVTIVFGERPDPKLSTIRVLDTSGASVTSGSTSAVATDPLALTVPVRTLVSGVYTVAWRTVSAVDGHLATGTFAFGVGVAPPATAGAGSSATVASNGPSPASIVGRWLLYLGLIPLAGAAFFALASGTVSRPLARVVMPAAWAAAAVGTVAVLAVEISDADVGLGDLPGTSLGTAAIVRLVPLLVAALGVLWVQRRPGRNGAAVVLAGGAGGMLADVAFSHAAAGGAAAFDMVVQAAHVLAVGLWLGGLVGLIVALRGEPGPETARVARRYARFATAGIAIVAVSGLIRAVSEVGTIDALVSTDFGRLVIAKTALLAVLALLGAVNHFRNVPAAGRALRGLRRVGSVELLVGATVLLLSASLVNLAPPSEVAAAQGGAGGSSVTAPLVVTGADYGTSVRLRLEVSPGQAGFNTFRATVTDYDTGAPVAATGVTLRFAMASRSDLGGSRLDLSPVAVGVFSATGSNLSLDGIWQVTALVVDGAASVEVPLELTTRAPSPTPSQQVDVNAVAGLPTIYTVHLSAGRTVQIYLDPGTPGRNEVHVTFFDATGTELAVPSAEMAIGPTGGTLAPLAPRILEPGHFVADTTLVAGTYTLSVAGPAPGGDVLSTRLDIPVTK